MKKLILFLVMFAALSPYLAAQEKAKQHLTPDQFRTKQQAFIAQEAGLTKEEAAKFFPVYFELQDLKKQFNDESWELIKQGRDEKTTEAQYEEILEKMNENRIASVRLEKNYLDKFKTILSFKKIYLVQRAEMRFHRELLKGSVNRGKGAAPAHRGAKK